MSGEVRDTANRIALHFNIWRHHLADERSQTTKYDDIYFVLGCIRLVHASDFATTHNVLLTARFPSAALAARCTSISGLCKRKSIGSRVSRPTSRTSAGMMSVFLYSISRAKMLGPKEI